MATTLQFTKIDTSAVTNLLDSQVLAATIQGIESTPNKNIQVLKLTGVDGEKVINTNYASRPITLEGKIVCATPSALRLKLEDLKRDVAGKGYLDVMLEGGGVRRFTVEVLNWIVTNAPHNLSWVPFAINMQAYDTPFGEDSSSTTIFSATGRTSDIEQTDNLSGSAEPAVKAQIAIPTVGSLAGIEFRDDATNTGLLVQPTFAANDTLAIDTGNESCLLNGLPVNFDGQVPTFRPGSNKWRLNFLTSSVTIDTQQTTYTTDKFIYGTTWLAQSFQASGAIKAHRVDVMLARLGNPTSVKLELYTDTAGAPGTAIAGANATVLGTNIPNTPSYISFYLQNIASLSAATTYWIVVKVTGATNDVNNGFYLKASDLNPYATYGLSRSANSGSSWATITNTDAVFRVWKTPVLVSNTDTTEESYVEPFSATTNKDGAATTANWDTTNTRLLLGTGASVDTGYKFPSHTPHSGSGFTGNDWTSPGNVYATDAVFATNAAQGSQSYDNFSFGVPSGNTILGIEIRVKGKVSAGTHNLFCTVLGTYNISRLSQALSNGQNAAFTTTNTSFVLGGPTSLFGQTWTTDDLADGTFTLDINAQDAGVTYSVDSVEVKIYYAGGYDNTKNVGQSIALNAANAAQMVTARMEANDSIPGSTSITYAVQPDAGLGFNNITNHTDTNLPCSALGTAPSQKWRATLSGTTSATPIVNDLTLYYRGAMPVGASTDRLAQSFASGAGGSVTGLLLNLVKDISDTCDYTVEIQTDSSGSPSGTVVTNGSATISAANVPNQAAGGSFSWLSVLFGTAPSLTASTTYWIVIKAASAPSGSKLLWRARGGDSYASGAAKYSTNSGSAYTAMTNQDYLFQVLSSGATFSADVTVSYKARSL